jgi:mannose/fructose/N-acetylgalactosamine-specific phosphotransferase system component IID
VCSSDLLVQASWSFKGMQSLGFFLLVLPALAERHGRRSPELREAALRHLELFNTHPYFAGLVAGTVAREEGDGATEVAAGLKRSLMCALGSVGDELFWALLRPLAALLALPFALAGHLLAPVLLLVAFNVPHLVLRAWGVRAGLARGREVVRLLQAQPLGRLIPALTALLLFLSGAFVTGGAALPAWGLIPGRTGLAAASAAAVFLALLALNLRGVGPSALLGGATAVAALAGAARLLVLP